MSVPNKRNRQDAVTHDLNDAMAKEVLATSTNLHTTGMAVNGGRQLHLEVVGDPANDVTLNGYKRATPRSAFVPFWGPVVVAAGATLWDDLDVEGAYQVRITATRVAAVKTVLTTSATIT